MYRMLAAFNLAEAVPIERFRVRYEAFVAHMVEAGLATGSGPIGRRDPGSGLDTDADRAQQYFVVMEFRDRAQSEAAFRAIKAAPQDMDRLHRAVWSEARDMVFVAWEDV